MGDLGTLVMADIPGLVEGAADGAGLGHQFLRHIRRTRIILHLISLGPDEQRDVVERYRAIRHELESFDRELSIRPEIVVLTKSDLVDAHDLQQVRGALLELGEFDGMVVISAVTRQGIDELKMRLLELLPDRVMQ